MSRTVSYRDSAGLTTFRRAVYAVVARLRSGQVLTYAAVALQAGFPGAARAVGTALRLNRFRDVPCHRVVCADGRVGGYAFGGSRAKTIKLRSEGVIVRDKRVVFPK